MPSVTEVLLVEDEPLIAVDVSQKLQKLGYVVSAVATRADEAYLAASATRPDLVVMDIDLDGTVNGIEAAAQIYSKLSIPIVFLTAHDDLQTLRKAQDTDPFGYLTKPATCSDLGNSIEIALQQHSKQKLHKLRELWLETQLLSVGAGLIATSQDGTIRFINPEGERLLGISKSEVIGTSFQAAVPLKNLTTGQTADDLVRLAFLQRGITSIGQNFIVETQGENRKITGEFSIARVEGEPIGLVFTFRDSTVERQNLSPFAAQLPTKEEDCSRVRLCLSETIQAMKNSLNACLSRGSGLQLAPADNTELPIVGNRTLVKSLMTGLIEHAQECSARPVDIHISTTSLDFERHNLDGTTDRYVRLKVDYRTQRLAKWASSSTHVSRTPADSKKAQISLLKVQSALASLRGTMQTTHAKGWITWSLDFPGAYGVEATSSKALSSGTVVLVESDAAIRAVLCDYLNTAGYECWGATDIGEARMWADSLHGQLDFVVLPEGEDRGEVQALQEEAGGASMVFVTNESQTAMNKKLIDSPNMHTIDSLFSKETLRAKLDELRAARVRIQLSRPA